MKAKPAALKKSPAKRSTALPLWVGALVVDARASLLGLVTYLGGPGDKGRVAVEWFTSGETTVGTGKGLRHATEADRANPALAAQVDLAKESLFRKALRGESIHSPAGFTLGLEVAAQERIPDGEVTRAESGEWGQIVGLSPHGLTVAWPGGVMDVDPAKVI